MQCPKCNCQLKRGIDKRSNTEIDYCPQCKGIWLDENELQVVCKFSACQISLPPNAVLSQRFCPQCEIEMYEFNYPETMVKVDMCPGCNGFWLDSGEIKEIELVRRHWVTSSRHKPKSERPSRNPDGKKSDYSLPGDKKYKLIDNLIRIPAITIPVIIFLAIAGGFSYWGLFGWKHQAKAAKQELQNYYAGMPNYEHNRQYIQQIIDTKHEQVYPKYKRTEQVSGESSYYDFDRKGYLLRMKSIIAKQAEHDNNKDVLNWANKYIPYWKKRDIEIPP